MSVTDRPSVAVLVPAAGSGTRMGGEQKQYRTLGGAPVLYQTLRIFESHAGIDAIVVAAPAADARTLTSELRAAGISRLVDVVEGGRSRQESVRAALLAVPASVEVVLVHDAVRPFVSQAGISGVIDAVRRHGAAALAVPLADTLREGEAGVFGDTVSREGLYRMQTPQGFRREWFAEAHERARQEGYEETDDVALVQRLGHRVHIVEGTSTNIKITTPADWSLAKAIWMSIQSESK